MSSQRIRITCIIMGENHENAYTAIKKLGWQMDQTLKKGISTREAVYDFLMDEGNNNSAYVLDLQTGKEIKVIAQLSNYGTKYVKTVADNIFQNNLLSLPKCTDCE